MKQEILEKAKKFIEITSTKDPDVIKDFINYEFRKRRLETRRQEEKDKISIKPILMNMMKLTESPIEQFLLNALVREGLPCEKQYRIGTKRVDFAFPENKLVVECDGYEWHKHDADQIEADQTRDKYLARKGWRVLHLEGIEIRNDIANCISKIKEALGITKAKLKKVNETPGKDREIPHFKGEGSPMPKSTKKILKSMGLRKEG